MTPTNKQPLFIVTGASCVGKSTMCEVLFQRETSYIIMESDLLWQDIYNTPEDDYSTYRRLWMRVCASISQINLPVVLCGCAVPKQFENHRERELFSEIHYLAVVCGDDVLEYRMRGGRKVTDEGWIKSSLEFNRWLKENAGKTAPPLTLLDTTLLTQQQAAEFADKWIMERIHSSEQEVVM